MSGCHQLFYVKTIYMRTDQQQQQQTPRTEEEEPPSFFCRGSRLGHRPLFLLPSYDNSSRSSHSYLFLLLPVIQSRTHRVQTVVRFSVRSYVCVHCSSSLIRVHTCNCFFFVCRPTSPSIYILFFLTKTEGVHLCPRAICILTHVYNTSRYIGDQMFGRFGEMKSRQQPTGEVHLNQVVSDVFVCLLHTMVDDKTGGETEKTSSVRHKPTCMNSRADLTKRQWVGRDAWERRVGNRHYRKGKLG